MNEPGGGEWGKWGGWAAAILLALSRFYERWRSSHREDERSVLAEYRLYVGEQRVEGARLIKRVADLEIRQTQEEAAHLKCLRRADRLAVQQENMKLALRNYETALREASIPFRPYVYDLLPEGEGDDKFGDVEGGSPGGEP